MNKGVLSSFLVFFVAVVSVLGELPQTVISYGKEFAKDIAAYRATYAWTTNRIPQKYVKDLEGLRSKYQEAGDLDGVLAVKKELDRYVNFNKEEADPFETVPEMTADVIVSVPAELRLLQEKYALSFSEANSTLKKNIKDRGEQLKAQILAAQTSLTKAGKIEDAIAVRDEANRVAQIIASGDISVLLEKFASAVSAEKAPSSVSDDPKPTVRQSVTKPSGNKWKYLGSSTFSADLPRYFDPDVPNELSGSFNSSKGVGYVSGKCLSYSAQVGAVLCSWNGKAFLWDVADKNTLPMDIKIKTRTLSPGADRGPRMEIAVLGNGIRIKSISVPLVKNDDVVRIMKDSSNDRRFALFWPKGKISETFEVPDGVRLNVMIGVALHNAGETCDVAFQLDSSNNNN